MEMFYMPTKEYKCAHCTLSDKWFEKEQKHAIPPSPHSHAISIYEAFQMLLSIPINFQAVRAITNHPEKCNC